MTKTNLFLHFTNGRSEAFISQLYTFCTLLPLYANSEHLGHMTICLSSCNIKCTAAPLPGQTLAGHQITDIKSSHFYTRSLVAVLINWETILTLFYGEAWKHYPCEGRINGNEMLFFAQKASNYQHHWIFAFSFLFNSLEQKGIISISIIFSRFKE